MGWTTRRVHYTFPRYPFSQPDKILSGVANRFRVDMEPQSDVKGKRGDEQQTEESRGRRAKKEDHLHTAKRFLETNHTQDG